MIKQIKVLQTTVTEETLDIEFPFYYSQDLSSDYDERVMYGVALPSGQTIEVHVEEYYRSDTVKYRISTGQTNFARWGYFDRGCDREEFWSAYSRATRAMSKCVHAVRQGLDSYVDPSSESS